MLSPQINPPPGPPSPPRGDPPSQGPFDPSLFRVAVLSDAYATVLKQSLTLAEVRDIGRNGSLESKTEKMWEYYARGGKRDPGYDKIKTTQILTTMPAIDAPRGTVRTEVSVENCHNRCYGFDIYGDRENMEFPAVRQALIETHGCLMVGVSCAGNALWAIFAGPVALDNDDYNAKRNAIIRQQFPELARRHNEGSRAAGRCGGLGAWVGCYQLGVGTGAVLSLWRELMPNGTGSASRGCDGAVCLNNCIFLWG